MVRVQAQYIDEYTGMIFICADTALESPEREEINKNFEALLSKLVEKELIQTISNFYMNLLLEPSLLIRQVRHYRL